MSRWGSYVPVATRRRMAALAVERLREDGMDVQPLEIQGRTIARSPWGLRWCEHFEDMVGDANRMTRGRTYARNGSVCHLEIEGGDVQALVSGSWMYRAALEFLPIDPAHWAELRNECRARFGASLEVMQGRMPDGMIELLYRPETGILPRTREFKVGCDCPDYAGICKHLAAMLYGIGHRIDSDPGLLVRLRRADLAELLEFEALPANEAIEHTIAPDRLADIFGVELDVDDAPRRGPGDAPSDPETNDAPRVDDAAAHRVAAQKRAAARRRSAAARNRRTSTNVRPGAKPDAKRCKSAEKTSRARSTDARTEAATPSSARAGKGRRRSSPAPPASRPPTARTIKQLRRRLGLDVDDLAEALGVTPATVRRWEATRGPLNLRSTSRAALDRLAGTPQS